MRTLNVLVPGLLAPPSGAVDADAPQPGALLALLARAAVHDAPASGYEALLLRLFDVMPETGRDMPVAALSRPGENAEPDDGWWLRADPVHLRPDQARLLLFGPRSLDILPDEARQLVKAFNALFGADGLHLEASHPQRWYLRLPHDPHLRTHPLPVVIGRDIDTFLPFGDNGKRWHGVLNETQMLFHSHPVNEKRESQGRLTINSVWFWGGGRLPVLDAQKWERVWSTEPLACGLARATGVPCADAPVSAQAWIEQDGEGAQLLVLEQAHVPALYGDIDGWRDAVRELEQLWFAPLLALLKAGRFNALTLYPGDGLAYRVTRAALWRFWRRRGRLQDHVRPQPC